MAENRLLDIENIDDLQLNHTMRKISIYNKFIWC